MRKQLVESKEAGLHDDDMTMNPASYLRGNQIHMGSPRWAILRTEVFAMRVHIEAQHMEARSDLECRLDTLCLDRDVSDCTPETA
jgi:hypothetical protein